jgi:hypothetical protein
MPFWPCWMLLALTQDAPRAATSAPVPARIAAALPSDAALYVAVVPARLAEDATFLNLTLRTVPALADAEDDLRAQLGFDPMRMGDWARIGVELEQPVVAAAVRIGPAAGDSQWRIVAALADRARWDTFTRNLARRGVTRRLRVRAEADRVSLDLRVRGGALAAQAAAPARLGRGLVGSSLPPLLGRGSVSAYVQLTPWLAQLPASCRRDLGPPQLASVAAVLRLPPNHWRLDVVAAAAPALAAVTAAPAHDDGILAGTPPGALVVARLYAAVLEPLRRLSRGDAPAGRAARCGPTAPALVALGYWPEQLGWVLDHKLDEPPPARQVFTDLLPHTRNLVVAIRSIGTPKQPDEHGAIAISLDGPPEQRALAESCSRQPPIRAQRALERCEPHGLAAPLAFERSEPPTLVWLPNPASATWWSQLARGTARVDAPALATFELRIAPALQALLIGTGADATARAITAALGAANMTAFATLTRTAVELDLSLSLESSP